MNRFAGCATSRPKNRGNQVNYFGMNRYTIGELHNIVKGELTGSRDAVFQHISVDSRTLVSPVETLFIALRGERHDGHSFIRDLILKGVRNFLVEEIPYDTETNTLNFVQVEDSLHAMQQLIRHHRSQCPVPVIAVTGSNGKTIVKEWLYQLLQPDKKVIRSPKSYNSQVGVPLSVWMLDPTYDMAVFEAGISKPGEMSRLKAMIQPDIGIITNLKEAHQENFSSYEEKAREKLGLFDDCKKIIYCRDHLIINGIAVKRFSKDRLFTWSGKPGADIWLKHEKWEHNQTILTVQYNGNDSGYSIPFSDQASVENSMHLISCMLYLNYSEEDINQRLKDLSPVAMRMELMHGINRCTLINDSYNSDLASLTIALDFLKQQNQHELKTLILSDIYQSGKSGEELYGEVAKIISGKGIKRFIGVGDQISLHKDVFKHGSFFDSTDDFLASTRQNDFADEAILIKGSRQFQFEKITMMLQQKTHGTILEVDLNAMIQNLNVFRSRLRADTKIMVMVKALSYGSGTYEIANALQYQQVDYLGVAFADEGIALRTAGIKTPVVVMNPEISSFDQMIEYQLEPEIYNFRSLHQFVRILKKHNMLSYPVHIKLNSGMNRLGFDEENMEELTTFLNSHEYLEVKTVFSHLAASEDPDQDTFTRKQISRFEKMSESLMNRPVNPMRHILNSAGIERFPDAQFEMVRVGIGLYGLSSVPDSGLQNVSTLKSTLSQLRRIRKGESIGYGRGTISDQDRTIGIVPIGYADGLDRRMGNGNIRFIVNGKPAEVVGQICMDMCFVDLTGVQAEEGDEIIIFGKEQPVGDLARSIQTISYEILAGISSRVKRIYFQE